MDHEAYERQMIDAVNRNADEKSMRVDTGSPKSTVTTKKNDATLKRGFKRTLLALLTAATFAISVFGFVAVASVPGYLAVLLFLTSSLGLGISFTLLYAQGITHVESKVNDK
jgi:hypothetical protein